MAKAKQAEHKDAVQNNLKGLHKNIQQGLAHLESIIGHLLDENEELKAENEKMRANLKKRPAPIREGENE